MIRRLPLLPPREERAGERRVVCPTRKPLSPTLSPFVPHGEREKIGLSPQQCLTKGCCESGEIGARMPTSARMWLRFFGQFADVGIRAPEQSGLLQQALTKWRR